MRSQGVFLLASCPIFATKLDCRRGQIEALNINTYVPPKIRHCISQLVRTGDIPIRTYSTYALPEENIITVKAHLLKPLGRLLDEEYLTKDSSKDVQEQLAQINAIKGSIFDYIDP